MRSIVAIHKKKAAFTLAEVLITLTVIGVVAAMTLPSLLNTTSSSAMNKKRILFDSRFDEAMSQMRVHNKIIGTNYSSAMEFVEELSKYLKINEICDKDNLTDCVSDTWYNGSEYLDVSSLTDGSKTGSTSIKNYLFDDNVAVIFSDGVTALINYNQYCEWLDPYTTEARPTSNGTTSVGIATQASGCVSMIYDLNGPQPPNATTVSSGTADLITYNATIGGSSASGWGEFYATVTPANCTNDETTDAKDGYCGEYVSGYTSDYWAGAAKKCGGWEYVPSASDYADLANSMYSGDGDCTSSSASCEPSEAVLSSVGMTGALPVNLWSSDEISATTAYYRYFASTQSGEYNRLKNTSGGVLCLASE